MTIAKLLLSLMPPALGLAVCLPVLAETPEQLQQRLEQYRELDAEAARKRAQQEAEAERRREQTRQWQEHRRREEYARRWKQYGDEEIDVLKWRQQKDGSWVTEFKELPPSLKGSPTPQETARVRFGDNLTITELLRLNPGLETARLVVGTQIRTLSAETSLPRRFDQSLDALVRQGIVKPEELDRIRNGWSSDLDALHQACRSGALSSAECRGGVAIRWGRRAGGASQPVRTPSSDSLLSVNCSSLMVNRKPAYQNWGNWARPLRGTSDEQLVIDRCSTVQP